MFLFGPLRGLVLFYYWDLSAGELSCLNLSTLVQFLILSKNLDLYFPWTICLPGSIQEGLDKEFAIFGVRTCFQVGDFEAMTMASKAGLGLEKTGSQFLAAGRRAGLAMILGF